jgi:hypothetical protein
VNLKKLTTRVEITGLSIAAEFNQKRGEKISPSHRESEKNIHLLKEWFLGMRQN